MRYDLTSLEIFVAVAETANLTRAAEQQHLAVSAISKRISDIDRAERIDIKRCRSLGVRTAETLGEAANVGAGSRPEKGEGDRDSRCEDGDDG